jgi:glycosyltransferase involved in cell wall biosynthesis
VTNYVVGVVAKEPHPIHFNDNMSEPMTIKRIFHGPITIGGIGWHLAEWQRRQGLLSDCIVYDDRGFRQLYHIKLVLSEYGRLRRCFLILSTFILVLIRYDVFHFYFGGTFFPYNLDLPILRLFRKKIIMTYCGSDIRLVDVARRSNNYSHLLKIGSNDPKYDRKKKWRMRWHSLWVNRFTAIRNLHEHATEVLPVKKVLNYPWLNNIGFNIADAPDPDELKCNIIPKLIHAPSNRGIKGSEYVTQAIETLKQRGIQFEYQELHCVSNAKVQKIIRNCDIVVDQFLIGGIGTLAFEGMGYGKPVVAYLPEKIVEKFIPGCPVYNATIDNLADRLEELINKPELRLELGKKGIAFVKKHLDYETIQREVIKIYEEL